MRASRLRSLPFIGLLWLTFFNGALYAQPSSPSESGAVESFEAVFDTAIVVPLEAGEFGITELMNAALEGDFNRVDALIRAGADVNAKDFRGDTALVRAVAYGHTEIATRLISAGADPNSSVQRGSTALGFAVQGGDIGSVRMLLSQGADPNTNIPSSQKSVLEYAAVTGKTDIIGALVEHGVDLQTHGPAALNMALWKGYADIAATLIIAGVDVNATPFDLDEIKHPQSGESALQTAAQSGHVVTIELLLKYGAEVQAADRRGQTALGYAVSNGHPGAVELLLSNGATVSAKNLSRALGTQENDIASALFDALVLSDLSLTELDSLIVAADTAGEDSIIEKLFAARASLVPSSRGSRLLFAKSDTDSCQLTLWDLATNSQRIVHEEPTECASKFFVSSEKQSLFVVADGQLQIVPLSGNKELSSILLPTELMKRDLAELLVRVRASYQTQIANCCSWMSMEVVTVGYLPSGEIGLVTHAGGPADETYRHLYVYANASWQLAESDSCHRFASCIHDQVSGRSLDERPNELRIWHPNIRMNRYFQSKSMMIEPKGDYDTWNGRVVLNIDGSVSEVIYSVGSSDHCSDDCSYTDGLKLRIAGRPDILLADYSGNNSFVDRYALIWAKTRGYSELIDLRTGETVLGEMQVAGWVE